MYDRINKAHPDAFKLITIRLDEGPSSFGYQYWRFPELSYQGAQ
jgi:hypothetical protein